jgi:hypothetical protein
VDGADRLALWLACFVLSMNVPFPEYDTITTGRATWWKADGVIVDVYGLYPSPAELQDFRGSWRLRKLWHVAHERGIVAEPYGPLDRIVWRAWEMLWMDSW